MNYRELLKDKKRIVVKIGSSSITYEETGHLNYNKLERLVRILCDIKNSGKEVILVSSGAIAVGRQAVGIDHKTDILAEKQACAAIGQGRLMMTYQKLFGEYNQLTAQVLLTKYTMADNESLYNARNTFKELLRMGAIPVVNENDTVSTYEIEFGDNDKLSALVASAIGADLLILLSDIDGLYTADPHMDKSAKLIDVVDEITPEIEALAGDSMSQVGTGGMSAKLHAAKIATASGADMVIANSADIDVVERIVAGCNEGTLFIAHKDENFDIMDYLD